jgi:hypothetical protein
MVVAVKRETGSLLLKRRQKILHTAMVLQGNLRKINIRAK